MKNGTEFRHTNCFKAFHIVLYNKTENRTYNIYIFFGIYNNFNSTKITNQ